MVQATEMTDEPFQQFETGAEKVMIGDILPSFSSIY